MLQLRPIAVMRVLSHAVRGKEIRPMLQKITQFEKKMQSVTAKLTTNCNLLLLFANTTETNICTFYKRSTTPLSLNQLNLGQILLI